MSPKGNFFYEYIAIGAIGLYIANYVYNRIANEILADAFYSSYLDFFLSQFSEVSDMEKLSQNLFRFYGTGRRHCQSMLAEVRLVPTQDLISLILSFFTPTYHTVAIEICHARLISPVLVSHLPQAGAKKRSRQSAQMCLRTQGIFLWSFSPNLLSARLTAKSCCLLHPPVAKTIAAHTKAIELIHFTDENATSLFGTRPEFAQKKAMRFEFRLPTSKASMSDVRKLVEMSLHLVDKMGTFRMTSKSRDRATAARRKVQELRFRETREAREEKAGKAD